MKHLKLLLLISIFLLCGCSSGEDVQPVENIVVSTVTPTPTSELAFTPTPKVIATPISEVTVTPKISELFTSVYLPYANREKPWLFSAVKAFAESCGYPSEITEPTEEIVGTIKVSDTNGDYVYFAFSENAAIGEDTIMIVSFYRAATNSEVSISNYSSDGSSEYDVFNVHVVGESDNVVASIEEQKVFLFN